MDVSLIIPLLNEEESLNELHDWIVKVVDAEQLSYEIIFIDDGSTDNSWKIIEQLSSNDPNVRAVKFRRNYGKSAALNKGFKMAEGDVVITMDADLQDSPDEIPGLFKMVKLDGFDLVSGWKKRRHDPIGKTLPSKFYNWTTRRMTGIKLHDFNCGLKAYANEVVKNVDVYGEMHRYIPVMAKFKGFTNIGEKVVDHQARKYGSSKYGLERYLRGFLDLTSIVFVSRFGKRPMHFFGGIGTIMFFLGFVAAVWVGAQKLISLSHGEKSILVTDSPYFFIALTMMILGTQLFLTGFLAEMLVRSSKDHDQYLVETEIREETSKKLSSNK